MDTVVLGWIAYGALLMGILADSWLGFSRRVRSSLKDKAYTFALYLLFMLIIMSAVMGAGAWIFGWDWWETFSLTVGFMLIAMWDSENSIVMSWWRSRRKKQQPV